MAKIKKPKTLRLNRPKVQLGERVYRLKLTRNPGLWVNVRIDKSGVGQIDSNLKNSFIADDDHPRMAWDRMAWNLQMDAIESLLLGLGCAGVDLDSPEFLQGFEAALEAISNNAS